MTEVKTIGLKELSEILPYSIKTIQKLLSKNPEKLPPRIAPLKSPTWYLPIVHQWLIENSVKNVNTHKRKGRPRNINLSF